MCRADIAVIGASGFIGSNVVAYGRSRGMDVTPIAMARVSDPAGQTAAGPTAAGPTAISPANIRARADDWLRIHHAAFSELCHALEPFAVVINAAGMAGPRSDDRGALFGANAVLPAVVARAAGAAGVRRLVHISTAAVQGRLDPLDETLRHLPLSPYASSKAAGERILLDRDDGHDLHDLPPELIVYRPTSVHGIGHRTTRTFARLVSRAPALPVIGAGEMPVPVALIENVAAGILFAATMPDTRPVVLQPHEDMSTASLLTIFGVRRIIHLPRRSTSLVLDQMAHLARLAHDPPRVASGVRWLELLLRGQAIHAGVLATAGFRPPAGYESWQALARQTTAERRPD